MPPIALSLLALAIQEAPQIVQWIDLASAANDLTDAQLAQLEATANADVAKFAAAVRAAKA